MSDGEPPKSRPIRAFKTTSGLLPANRGKPLPSPELQSEADKRREVREVAKEQREEAKEKREERAARLSRRVATFAVVVSLVGSGATATVAIMSMKATQATAQANIRSSAEQAQSAFLRDQKKVAYADFYSATTQAGAAEVKMILFLMFPWAPTTPKLTTHEAIANYLNSQFNALSQGCVDRLNDLAAKYALVYMVGSEKAIEAAKNIHDLFASNDLQRARGDAFNLLIDSSVKNVTDDTETNGALDTYKSLLNPSVDLLTPYLDAVREDYGQGHVGPTS